MKETHPQSDVSAAEKSITQCPVCAHGELETFFELPDVPVFCNVFPSSPIAANRANRGDIDLGLCRHCGTIFNRSFDEGLLAYCSDYENSLHFSQKFRAYADALADRLSKTYDLDGKSVVEIGCGKGDFLALLAQRNAGARCIGFDRSYAEDQVSPLQQRLTNLRVVADEYSHLHYPQVHADFLITRHVLEHVSNPRAFLLDLRKQLLPDGGSFYFEVPNTDYQLRELGIWDIIYEHCAYYTAESLTWLLRSTGFEPTTVHTSFGGQFLVAEGHTGPIQSDSSSAKLASIDSDELGGLCQRFGDEFAHKVLLWNDRIAQRMACGERIAVWGAGSKGVTFLNVVAGGTQVAAVVDLNERKQNRHVPGTAQRITSPEELRSLSVDTVLVMNPLYRDEIEAQLRDLGLRVTLLTV